MGEGSHLLFVTKPTGYELAEREGEPPAPGEAVDIEGENGRYTVVKVATSPLPGDPRLCAYLIPA